MNNPTSLLIIDDNFNFLKAISEFIAEHYTGQILVIAIAQNGKDGIRLAGQLHPQVVLLDLKLPDMHGFIVIPMLRQLLPEVMIITTTFLSCDELEQSRDIYQQESLKAGANTFIPKYRLDKDLAPTVIKKMDQILD